LKDFNATQLSTTLGSLENQIRPLPIGLTGGQVDYLWSMVIGKRPITGAGIWWFLTKLFGLAITAFAISLGAPFWFDVLSKFMNIRGTGTKPEPDTPASPGKPASATTP
jgi:hypothetical protein